MDNQERDRQIQANTEAIRDLTNLLREQQEMQRIQGYQMAQHLDGLKALSELRDKNAQDIRTLVQENREVNAEIKALLIEFREERAHDQNN